ncbi:hypothetical protein BDQ17DRAFT_1336245 [Cyathus striatus]|nr:hypothetical protein BDQ17DRAFT_1336245 [Cyathus striatus]
MIDFNIDFALQKRTHGLVDKLSLILNAQPTIDSYIACIMIPNALNQAPGNETVRSPGAYQQQSIRIEATGVHLYSTSQFANPSLQLTLFCIHALHKMRQIQDYKYIGIFFLVPSLSTPTLSSTVFSLLYSPTFTSSLLSFKL